MYLDFSVYMCEEIRPDETIFYFFSIIIHLQNMIKTSVYLFMCIRV